MWNTRARRLLLALTLAQSLPAWAATPGVSATADAPASKRPLVGWPILELRGGLDASATGAHAMVCAEVSPYEFVAVEACGTGAGFLYPSGQSEMAHFRAEAIIALFDRARTDLSFQPGLGFAELQVGQDDPGFLFGPARSADQRAGAGPEASGSLKVRAWPHPGIYLSGEFTTGAAWIPSAPTVTGSDSVLVPFAAGSVGVGF